MIKKLFLIDGLAGTGKSDLIDFVHRRHKTNSIIIQKYTTRERRNPEEATLIDLTFVGLKEFELLKVDGFYFYEYGNEFYGFYAKQVFAALQSYENVFIIVRDRSLIKKISKDFETLAYVIPVFVYTDRDQIVDRLKRDGFDDEQIGFRLKRAQISWDDYLEYPDGALRIIINNSDKAHFNRKINSLIDEFSSERIDCSNIIFINPTVKFELIKPLEGFKHDILCQLEKFSYEKNIFLMMKFRESNLKFYHFIKNEVERAGYNCVRADEANWNITNNVYNPIAVLYCCKYGIALFDEPEEGQNYNPNVAYELGIMQYQSKRCLILKKDDLPDMPFDLIKDLRKVYNTEIDFQKIFSDWLIEMKG